LEKKAFNSAADRSLSCGRDTFSSWRTCAGDISTVWWVRIPPRAQGISLGRVVEENEFLFKEQKKRGCAGDISTHIGFA